MLNCRNKECVLTRKGHFIMYLMAAGLSFYWAAKVADFLWYVSPNHSRKENT